MPLKLTVITVAIDDFEGLCKTIDSVELSPYVQHIIKLIPDNIDARRLKILYPHLDIIVSHDSGIYDAMNQALPYVRSSHLLFLNVRDLLAPGSLAFLLHLLDLSSQEVVYKFLPVVLGKKNYERASLLYFSRHMLNHQTIVYPSHHFRLHKFDLSCRVVGDLRHFLESQLFEYISYVDVPLVVYDMTSNFALKASSIRANWLERFMAFRWNIPFRYKIVLSFVAILGILHVTFFRRFRFLWT